MEDKKLTAETARQIWSEWLKARAGKFTPGELMDECSDLLGRLQQRGCVIFCGRLVQG